ncbi:MAG: outer membrane beta-barrel protein, partial [Reyranella sp.]|nr:outer membrane beta-barrel protein [Reyranella sp.]
GYEPLTIRPAFMRSINESAYSNYQNYVSTTLGIDFTYDIHDAWKMVGGTGFNIAEYNPVPGSGVGPRTDYYWRASLGLLYSLRPQVQIGPLYEHTSGSSTDVANGGPSYTREVISIRVVGAR